MHETKEKEVTGEQQDEFEFREQEEERFKIPEDRLTEKKINAFIIGTAMISIAIFSLAMALIYTRGSGNRNLPKPAAGSPGDVRSANAAALQERIAPSGGIVLPVTWGDTGIKLTQSGVVDTEQLKALYAGRGGMTPEMLELLEGAGNGQLKITPQNSGYLLNLLWAFGLGQKSAVLENGPMQDKKYGNAGQFASTGGWTIARGGAMSHYSKHNFVNLTEDQKALVERVAKNIYRPCCGNSTYFPDCNHGMAMLGLLELMASQGVSESEIYRAALAVNSYWFPDTYDVIAQYFQSGGIDWSNVDPKVILSEAYSSGGGFRNIQAALTQAQSQSQNQPSQPQTDPGAPVPRRSSGGCGV